jgi:hypothetical protein
MTRDNHAGKNAARRRQAATGEPYTAARRRTAGDSTADLVRGEDVPPAVMPAPTAIMLARHLDAATLHLGAAATLARDADLTAWGDRYGTSGPLKPTATAAHHALYELRRWAETSAVASGAIHADPMQAWASDPQDKQAGHAAQEALYPARHLWCAQPGRTLPQPGEQPDQPEHRVRYQLPGPVPDTRLAAHTGAGKVMAGTPAEAVWQADKQLTSYVSDWMDRPGDTPADLAAALDGLIALSQTLADAAAQVCREIRRRRRDGRLVDVDDRFDEAVEQLNGLVNEHEEQSGARMNHLAGALHQARTAIDGAHAATVTPATAVGVRLAAKLDGTPMAAIRAKLGEELFMHRQIERVHAADTSHAAQLVAILDWMQATGVDRYDAHAHRGLPPQDVDR